MFKKRIIAALAVVYVGLHAAFCGYSYSIESQSDYFDRGVAYGVQGNFFEARDAFKKILELDRFNAKARSSLQIASDAIHEKVKRDTAIFIFSGIKYANEMMFDEALIKLNDAVERETNYAAGYVYRGIVLIAKGFYKQARVEFDRAITIRQEYAEAYFYRGFAAELDKDTTEALANYDKAVELDMQYIQAYYRRSSLNEDLRGYDRAIRDYTSVLELYQEAGDPPKEVVLALYWKRGRANRLAGRFKEAMADLNEAMKIDKNETRAYFERAIAYGIQEDINSALADLNTVLALDQNNAKAYYMRGLLDYKLGNYVQAISDYDKALSNDPGLIEVFFNKAIACEKSVYPGHIQDAIAAYKEFIKSAPPQYMFVIETAQARLKDLEKQTTF